MAVRIFSHFLCQLSVALGLLIDTKYRLSNETVNHDLQTFCFLCCPLLVHEQKYPPSATTLHFEFYAEPGPEVKVERKVRKKVINGAI